MSCPPPRRAAAALSVILLFAVACRSNIKVPDEAPAVSPTFSMIIASDTQYPWWTTPPCQGCTIQLCEAKQCDPEVCAGGGKPAITECAKRLGGASIRDQIVAASKITDLSWPANMGGTKINAPVGLIVNGDLTESFHEWQVKEVDHLLGEELDKVREANPNHPILKIVPFLGLGNHDYRNNVCDCSDWGPYDRNSCPRVAVHKMRFLYGDKSWIRFDACSLAYSWTFGKIRFVQMHFWPGYTADFARWRGDDDRDQCLDAPNRFSPEERTCDDSVVYPSWTFLDKELKAADANGERVVLLFHDPDGSWSNNDVLGFKAHVAKHGVIAVFAGHYHDEWGVRTGYAIAKGLRNKFNEEVPVILSGASAYRKLVIAEFTANSMKAAVIAVDGGTPSFQAATTVNPTPAFQTTWQ